MAWGGVPANAQLPDAEGRIAFTKGPETSSTGVFPGAGYTMRPDGSDQGTVTPVVGDRDLLSELEYSPEGLRIAYVTADCDPNEASAPCPTEIYVMLANGLFPTLLTYSDDISPAVGSGSSLTWDPNGTGVIYPGVAGGRNFDLYETKLAGLATENLTHNDMFESSPTYAPDGSGIAFVAQTPGKGDVAIYHMDGDGSGVRRLSDDFASPRDLDWSPAGDRIAFTANVPDSTTPFGRGEDIFTIGADGTNLVRVTAKNGPDRNPSYSPDGSRIAFTSGVPSGPGGPPGGAQQLDVYVARADGSKPINISNDPDNSDVASDWGPVASAAAAPLPVPPPVLDACPGAESKRIIPASKLTGTIRGDEAPDVILTGRRGRGATGASGDDCLFAGSGEHVLDGGVGEDVLSGGAGRDLLRCGPGNDLAIADRHDRVSGNCEKVRRRERSG